ncbi:MAG: ABC transporter substrate-binding protein [Bdellovibrionales bacterium]|nr:ABC transporter substrate-binding protein [Bdellovibrionales bacterium]
MQCIAEEYNVGLIAPLTGDFARYGEKIADSVNKATPEGFKLLTEDEACTGRVAITSYNKLSKVDNVKFYLGPWCGSPQLSVAPLFKKNLDIALIGNSAPEMMHKASGGRMFSTQHSIEAESRYNAKQMNERGYKSAVIIFFENDFSRAHESGFKEVFKGKIYETFAYNSRDISTLKSIVLRIKHYNPDVIYSPDAYPLMHGFVRELYNSGLGHKQVWSVYSAQFPDILEVLGEQGNGLIYSHPDIGEDDALSYFSNKAANILYNEITNCKADSECVRLNLNQKYDFTENGYLKGDIILKTIKDKKFVKLEL